MAHPALPCGTVVNLYYRGGGIKSIDVDSPDDKTKTIVS